VKLGNIRKSRLLRKTIGFATFPITKQFGKYCDLYKSQECYIFGDGASVKSMDLKLFSDKPAIAVGTFPCHQDISYTNLKFWVLPEPMFFWPVFRKGQYKSRRAFRAHQKFFSPKTFVPSNVSKLLSVTNFPKGWSPNTFYLFDRFPHNHKNPPSFFSRSDLFAGSINASISLAIYLGFKKVFLVGFDYTHNPPTSGHWYEIGQGALQKLDDYNVEFFEAAQELIELVTVTSYETQTTIPSLSYQEHTGAQLIYKENHELTTQEVLVQLNKTSEYRIFS
jgi:hypothetical protein